MDFRFIQKVYIYRNPKDTAVSLYYFLQSQRRINFHGDLEHVVDSFIEDHVEFGPYFEHLASFWSRRHEDPNIFFVSFEELKRVLLTRDIYYIQGPN